MLDVYRSMVLSAERAVLNDPTLPLTYLVARTADFELLLPALLRLAEEVEKRVRELRRSSISILGPQLLRRRCIGAAPPRCTTHAAAVFVAPHQDQQP